MSNLKELLKIYKELNNKKNRHIDFTSLKINKMIKLIDPRKMVKNSISINNLA